MTANTKTIPAGVKGRRSTTAPAPSNPAAGKPRSARLYKVSGGKISHAATDVAGPAFAGAADPPITYAAGDTVRGFIDKIRGATTMQLVGVEREGVRGRLLKDIAREMDIPASRLFAVIGVPKATADRKASDNEVLAGAGGQAALGIIHLLGIAQGIVKDSTAAAARGFDASKWLGAWIERPQPALGGKRPADILDTPTGLEVVARTLGAIESGAYL